MGGVEKYGCSNFFTKGCTYQLEKDPLPFSAPEIQRTRFERVIEILVIIMLIIGYLFFEILLVFVVGILIIQLLNEFRRRHLLEFWKQDH